MARKFDALILGAGAAGLMCAIEAGKRGRRVATIEHAERAGKKILISGGGRCNFTNIYCQPENFISQTENFAKSALARYTPADFIALIEKHRIPYHEKTLGQLFCDRSAEDVTQMLETECSAAGVKMFCKAIFARYRAPMNLWCGHKPRSSARRCWWWRPEGNRFRRWARRRLVTSWRGDLG
jgi:hypothetical protein